MISITSCSKKVTSVHSSIFGFRSTTPKSTYLTLQNCNDAFALDTYNGIFYYKEKGIWKANNPEVNTFKELAFLVAQEEQIVKTRGYFHPGDGGAASYKVYNQIPGENYTEANAIRLSNGKYAVMLFEGRVNVISFGAKGDADGEGNGTDDSKAFQNAIDFISNNGGGKLYIPSFGDKFFKISKIYIKNGVRLSGDAASISQEKKSLIGSKIIVSNGGVGVIVGDNEFYPTKRIKGIIIENLIIKGTPKSVSGIRLGSDRSFITPAYITIRNCVVEGFSNPNVNQPIYDLSSVELGKGDGNYEGAFPVRGACGVFIAGVVSLTLDNVISHKNYYGLYESAGGLCTAVSLSAGSYSENTKNGIVFTSLKSATMNNLVVVESNKEAGIKIFVPKTNIKNLINGPTNIYLNNIHLESNNFRKKDGYSIIIENMNEGYHIKNVFINNNRLDFHQADGIYINRGKNINISSNSILVLKSRTQLKTTNCEYVEYSGQIYGKMDTDAQTKVFRKNKKTANSSGGILADYRTVSTRRNGSNQSLIIQGDIGLLPENINSKAGAFKIIAWGTVTSKAKEGALQFKFNNQIIAENSLIPSSASTWYAEINISVFNTPSIQKAKVVTLLQVDKKWEAPQITTISAKSLWDKINRIYILGNTEANALTSEGYQVSFEAY